MLTVEEHLLLLERILIRALGEADADGAHPISTGHPAQP
jgi:hypothetical protein